MGNHKGRIKGSVNKSTAAKKEILRVESAPIKAVLTLVANTVLSDIDRIYRELSPREKVDLLKTVLPYIQPRLETIKYEDANGETRDAVHVIVLGSKTPGQ